MITLTYGIQGYFVPSVCGANCSDALVFWIYDGYQYMLGLKSGAQSDLSTPPLRILSPERQVVRLQRIPSLEFIVLTMLLIVTRVQRFGNLDRI